MGEDHLSGRRHPFPGVIDAGVGERGADDRAGGDGNVVHLLEDAFEHPADISPAAVEEAGGVGVAIDGRAVGEVEVFGDVLRAAPIEEAFLDGDALGVFADRAAALMLDEVHGLIVVGGYVRCG